ncbi:MAG: hypothetical protein MK185_04795 [Saccharospirillaceae bacterium]|nr:hypothetical protein [Saccharospirillaceae bacterium]
MTHRTEAPIEAPSKIILRKLAPNDTVEPGDVMPEGNHFFPVSICDVPASEYSNPVYRQSAEETPAVSAENAS